MENKNFTMISNEIIRELSANELALYCKIQFYGGYSGQCYTSKQRLRTELKLGRKAIDKSFQFLLDRKLIFKGGTKQTMTPGGLQNIQIYNLKGRLEVHKGWAERTTSNTNTKKEEKDRLKEHTLTKSEKVIIKEEQKKEQEMEEMKLKKLAEIREELKNKFSINKPHLATR